MNFVHLQFSPFVVFLTADWNLLVAQLHLTAFDHPLVQDTLPPIRNLPWAPISELEQPQEVGRAGSAVLCLPPRGISELHLISLTPYNRCSAAMWLHAHHLVESRCSLPGHKHAASYTEGGRARSLYATPPPPSPRPPPPVEF